MKCPSCKKYIVVTDTACTCGWTQDDPQDKIAVSPILEVTTALGYSAHVLVYLYGLYHLIEVTQAQYGDTATLAVVVLLTALAVSMARSNWLGLR